VRRTVPAGRVVPESVVGTVVPPLVSVSVTVVVVPPPVGVVGSSDVQASHWSKNMGPPAG
jgi:hypothetical protein